jgi:hypothetical protein
VAVRIRYGEADVDWAPLSAVIDDDALGDWMWMHTCEAPATKAAVHFYKHVLSRRYLRLDAEGRVYRETRDGVPVVLPGCGGATLLVQLIKACAVVEPGLPARIALPPAARELCRIEDLPTLQLLLLDALEELDHWLSAADLDASSGACDGEAVDEDPDGLGDVHQATSSTPPPVAGWT